EKMCFFIIMILLTSATVFSADLVNKDSKKYNIEVTTYGTLNISIGANTTLMSGAPDGSTIKIKETGSTIKVNGNKPAIIKDGKLSQ
ncbi:MAG: hypothetical protein N3F66_10485, partial [Spirochaetes bacterium]|nr:hypothetical protein [Spirochaetota bacterium]